MIRALAQKCDCFLLTRKRTNNTPRDDNQTQIGLATVTICDFLQTETKKPSFGTIVISIIHFFLSGMQIWACIFCLTTTRPTSVRIFDVVRIEDEFHLILHLL